MKGKMKEDEMGKPKLIGATWPGVKLLGWVFAALLGMLFLGIVVLTVDGVCANRPYVLKSPEPMEREIAIDIVPFHISGSNPRLYVYELRVFAKDLDAMVETMTRIGGVREVVR